MSIIIIDTLSGRSKTLWTMNRSAKLWFVSHSAETSSVAIAHAPATPTTWPWRNDGVATLRKAFLLPALSR